MTQKEVVNKNRETANQLSSFSVYFFKGIFKFLKAVCAFIKCVYQDYIFNRNYKRYLKYIDIYENCEDEEIKNV